MTDTKLTEWNPLAKAVLQDQIKAYDDMRQQCPIAHSDFLNYSLFRHQDVMSALNDHQTFSSVTSQHVSVPNNMDPPEHTAYRKMINGYFNEARMAEFEPACRTISATLVKTLVNNSEIDFVSSFCQIFAVQAQCFFLGWPSQLHAPLLQWLRKNHEATRNRDKTAMAEVAQEFNLQIKDLLETRRKNPNQKYHDITASLMNEKVNKQPLSDEEIISILRNWTVGEMGTITASIGIIAQYLAEHHSLQQHLKENPSQLSDAIDEILRIHPPLIANRRICTRSVEIAGQQLNKGDRISILWASANRDESVFGNPDEFQPDKNKSHNLLYGKGIHICPGAPLARLELVTVISALLNAVTFSLIEGKPPIKACYPASGYSSLPLKIQKTKDL